MLFHNFNHQLYDIVWIEGPVPSFYRQAKIVLRFVYEGTVYYTLETRNEPDRILELRDEQNVFLENPYDHRHQD